MQTLILLSALAIFCLALEIFGTRSMLRWIVLSGLALIGFLELTNTIVADWGLEGMVVSDAFGKSFSLLFIGLGMIFILLSGSFYRREPSKLSDYIALQLFALCGAVALVTFGNLSMYFLGLEVMSVTFYTLAGSHKRDRKSNEAAMKYFLMGSFASGVLLFGIALVYAVTASFDIQQIQAMASAQPHTLLHLGVLFILFASLFKIGAVPFHFWSPDVYEGSPALHTAYFSTIGKAASLAAFYRLFSHCFQFQIQEWNAILAVLSALTISLGTLSALNQQSLKRLLAFSGISHVGYMLMLIMAMGAGTQGALFYYILAYSVSTVLAFGILISVMEYTGNDLVSSFSGLGKSQPFLGAAFTLALLSMAGIPPLAGFFAKYYLFTEAVRSGYFLLVVWAVIHSIISVYVYFKVILSLYGGEPMPGKISLNPQYLFAIILCCILLVVFGIFPSPIMALIQ